MHAFLEALSDSLSECVSVCVFARHVGVSCDDTKLVKYVPVVSASRQSVRRQYKATTAAANSETDSNKSRQRQFVLICQTVNCGQMLSMQLANVIFPFSSRRTS